jgi:CheY-like chemotaxis protein
MARAGGDTIFDDIENFGPHLVLMDVMLARLDGSMICKQIKENPLTHSLPVILISGTHNLSESMHLPGAPDGFIAKPFDPEYLLNSIAKQLTAHQPEV